MRDYIIATDSCCDFDENLIRELDLTVIPLSVHLGQDHFRNYPGEMPESQNLLGYFAVAVCGVVCVRTS